MSMKKFIYKSELFFLPIAVILFPAWIHLTGHREIKSVSEMVDQNQKNGGLIGLAYTDPMHLVKHAVIERRQPKIIALGTSRVLPIRERFFTQPQLFYNCGRSVGKLQDLIGFINSYPGEKPQIMLLGLDQDFFNVEDEDLLRPSRSYSWQDGTYGTRLSKGTKALLKSLRDGEVTTGNTLPVASDYIGRNARLYQEGYRRDGSYCYGRTFRQVGVKSKYDFGNTIRRIDKGKGRFATAKSINPKTLRQLADFLECCKNNNIHVVAFLPPYAGKVYDRFGQDAGSYPHVFDLHNQLKPLFVSHGLVCEDYSDIRSLGANDFETTDGFHGSEVCYLKLLNKLSKEDKVLASYLDQSYIEQSIVGAFSARQIVEEVPENDPKHPIRNLEER